MPLEGRRALRTIRRHALISSASTICSAGASPHHSRGLPWLAQLLRGARPLLSSMVAAAVWRQGRIPYLSRLQAVLLLEAGGRVCSLELLRHAQKAAYNAGLQSNFRLSMPVEGAINPEARKLTMH